MSEQFRHEDKYQIDDGEILEMSLRLSQVMRQDPHVGPDGIYEIRSVYFDDFERSCFGGNESGVNIRAKWRIRMYNCRPDALFLERKKKENGMIRKQTCPITLEQYRYLTSSKASLPSDDGMPPLLRRFVLLRAQYLFRPQIIVQYERRPYIFGPGNVRITFDRNIAAGKDLSLFFDRHLPVLPVLPTGQHLLEVKYDAFLPDIVQKAVQQGDMQRVTFSKYFICMQAAGKTA